MFVTKPVFFPSDGYVEDIDESGRHYLKKVESSPSIENLEAETQLLKAQLQAQADRSEFLEDCMAELAVQAYQ